LNKYRICCLTYGGLNALAEQAVKAVNDPELEITCLSTRISTLTQNLTADIQEQAEVFVAGSSNLRATKQMLNVPCVGIEVDYQDYLHHILTVAREGRHHQVGIVTYQEPLPYDFQEIEALVGVKGNCPKLRRN
jgi:propionate catabolism operon transcriptional regulator